MNLCKNVVQLQQIMILNMSDVLKKNKYVICVFFKFF